MNAINETAVTPAKPDSLFARLKNWLGELLENESFLG
jgi:hypothetical protein